MNIGKDGGGRKMDGSDERGKEEKMGKEDKEERKEEYNII